MRQLYQHTYLQKNLRSAIYSLENKRKTQQAALGFAKQGGSNLSSHAHEGVRSLAIKYDQL